LAEAYVAAMVTGNLGDPRAAVARAAEAAKAHGCDLQLVRPEAVASARHVASAVEHALRARRDARDRANSLGLEVLRYLTGERQIARALELAGLLPGNTRAVAIAVGAQPRQALEAAARVLDLSIRWDEPIGSNEAAEGPVLERVALLDLER
jgi:tRNA threonylcarbamoyladenosine modification (KEOPS) complex Cgi121 subunit